MHKPPPIVHIFSLFGAFFLSDGVIFLAIFALARCGRKQAKVHFLRKYLPTTGSPDRGKSFFTR